MTKTKNTKAQSVKVSKLWKKESDGSYTFKKMPCVVIYQKGDRWIVEDKSMVKEFAEGRRNPERASIISDWSKSLEDAQYNGESWYTRLNERTHTLGDCRVQKNEALIRAKTNRIIEARDMLKKAVYKLCAEDFGEVDFLPFPTECLIREIQTCYFALEGKMSELRKWEPTKSYCCC